MKVILIVSVILLIFSATFVSAAEITNVSGSSEDSPKNTEQRLLSIEQKVQTMDSKIKSMPSKSDMDSSFQQLDSRVSQTNQANILNFLAFLVGVIIFNDILVFGLFIIFKNRGLIA